MADDHEIMMILFPASIILIIIIIILYILLYLLHDYDFHIIHIKHKQTKIPKKLILKKTALLNMYLFKSTIHHKMLSYSICNNTIKYRILYYTMIE